MHLSCRPGSTNHSNDNNNKRMTKPKKILEKKFKNGEVRLTWWMIY